MIRVLFKKLTKTFFAGMEFPGVTHLHRCHSALATYRHCERERSNPGFIAAYSYHVAL
ncbi:MAG: hypothetical protein ABI597_12665 [Gammaproteobacteria bacterium]